jgi:hypothetical protein
VGRHRIRSVSCTVPWTSLFAAGPVSLQNINNPYGSYPGYLALIEKEFNRAGEKAWLLGFSYDLKDT